MVYDQTNLKVTKLFSTNNGIIDPTLKQIEKWKLMDWLSNIFGYTMPVKKVSFKKEQKVRIGK